MLNSQGSLFAVSSRKISEHILELMLLEHKQVPKYVSSHCWSIHGRNCVRNEHLGYSQILFYFCCNSATPCTILNWALVPCCTKEWLLKADNPWSEKATYHYAVHQKEQSEAICFFTVVRAFLQKQVQYSMLLALSWSVESTVQANHVRYTSQMNVFLPYALSIIHRLENLTLNLHRTAYE